MTFISFGEWIATLVYPLLVGLYAFQLVLHLLGQAPKPRVWQVLALYAAYVGAFIGLALTQGRWINETLAYFRFVARGGFTLIALLQLSILGEYLWQTRQTWRHRHG